MSAGILWVPRRRSPHLRILWLRSPSQGCLGRVGGPRTVGFVPFGASALMRCRKEALQPNRLLLCRSGARTCLDRSQACMVLHAQAAKGTACTKVVLQSPVRIRRWYDVGYAVILPRRRFRAWTSSLVSGFCSSACCLSPCLVPSSLWSRWLLASPSVASRRPPGVGAVLVLSVLRFFVVLVDLAVEEFFLLSSVLLSLFGSCFWFYLDFDVFLLDSVFGPFYCIFPSCGVPARWRDLPYVVPASAASSFPPGG